MARKEKKKRRSFLTFPGGFTLIELMVVMMLFVTVGTIMTNVFFSLLRGSRRTDTISTVQQNGNYTLTQIARMIRFAKDLEGVRAQNGDFITDCSNKDKDKKYESARIKNFDESTTTLACEANKIVAKNSSGDNQAFLDTSAVDLKSCHFTCFQENFSSPPSIGIYFTLESTSGDTVNEKPALIEFKTTVVPRNYIR